MTTSAFLSGLKIVRLRVLLVNVVFAFLTLATASAEETSKLFKLALLNARLNGSAGVTARFNDRFG